MQPLAAYLVTTVPRVRAPYGDVMKNRFVCSPTALPIGRVRAFVAAAIVFVFIAGPARAVTFDVAGQNIFGTLVTGTIDGDPALTSVTAANLSISGQLGVFNIIDSYSGMVLSLHNGAGTFFPSVALFFSGSDAANYLATQSNLFAAEEAELSALLADNFLGQNDPAIAEVREQLNDNALRFAATVVAETTPLPASLPLFAAGLGALGLLGLWRKKKTALVL